MAHKCEWNQPKSVKLVHAVTGSAAFNSLFHVLGFRSPLFIGSSGTNAIFSLPRSWFLIPPLRNTLAQQQSNNTAFGFNCEVVYDGV